MEGFQLKIFTYVFAGRILAPCFETQRTGETQEGTVTIPAAVYRQEEQHHENKT